MWNQIGANKLCQLKENISFQKRHLNAIANVKPFVNTAKPKTQARYQSRLTNKYANTQSKKLFYENQVLLKKMMEIEKRSLTINPLNPEKYDLKTSQQNFRARQQEQISSQNLQLLKRLQSASSAYQKASWVNQLRDEVNYLRIAQKHPKQYDYNNLVRNEYNQFGQTSEMNQFGNYDNIEDNTRPVTAPNPTQFPLLDDNNSKQENNAEFYCENCNQKFDFVTVVPKMVPCKEKHVFCQGCLTEAGRCLVDGYEFKTLPENLQTLSFLQLKKYEAARKQQQQQQQLQYNQQQQQQQQF